MQTPHETAVEILKSHDGSMSYDDFSRALADDEIFDFLESPGDTESFMYSLAAKGLVRLSDENDDEEMRVSLIVASFAAELSRLEGFLQDKGGLCGLTVLETMFGEGLPDWGARQRAMRIVGAGVAQGRVVFDETIGIVKLPSAQKKTNIRKKK